MSRPQSRKVVNRLEEGEALVVGPVSAFETLISVVTAFSTMDEYDALQQAEWASTAAWLRNWVDSTSWESDEWD